MSSITCQEIPKTIIKINPNLSKPEGLLEEESFSQYIKDNNILATSINSDFVYDRQRIMF